VQSTQLPALKREMIESKGPHGVMFNQQGNFMNAQDITIAFKEVISGKALEALRSWVTNKEYLQITLALVSESQPESVYANSVVLEDAWIEIDAVDLSVDDTTVLVKPSGTIHGNWVTWPDEEQETLPWE
jgi:ferredoxin-fold anticodon binding domain-containing protein